MGDTQVVVVAEQFVVLQGKRQKQKKQKHEIHITRICAEKMQRGHHRE